MKKLIINSANEELTILLSVDNKLFFCAENESQRHNEILLTQIDKLLKQSGLKIADLDEFGVVIGPGSFTGIRVGVATIKALRDATKKPAFGLNNLDLLYALATSQNKEIETVAILGSFNSYFVAKLINGVVFKFEHNLTLEQLKLLAENKPVGMFKADENLNCYVVKQQPKTMLECFNKNKLNSLEPVYYQLSQAENEKLKRAEIKIKAATKKDLQMVANLEAENILTNTIPFKEICNMFLNKTYKFFVASVNGKIVGYIIVQLTDEANIVSIAVAKQFRNLGLATKLIEHAKKHALKNEINTLSLEVNEKNITAFLLYKKLGFKTRRTRKNYYADGSNCLEMFLKI